MTIVKIDGWDIGLPYGPVVAKDVVFSGRLQGGHGPASWWVPVENAYLAPHPLLQRGAWVELYDGEHEYWEGQITSVRPDVDVTGQHRFLCTGDGLLATAAKRGDRSQTWVHRGAAGWRIHPAANRSGEYTVGSDTGFLKLLIRTGAQEDYVTPMRVVYYIDDLLSDDYVSHVDCVATWDVTDEAPYSFSWDIWCDGTFRSESDTSGTATAFNDTPAGNQKAVIVQLWGIDLTGVKTLTADKYVEFPTLDVYGSSQTAKVRVDEAMCAVATRPGLALSTSSQAIGAVLDDLHFGRTNDAQILQAAAKLHAAPVDWGFWDNRSFRVKPLDRRPLRLDQTIVLGGGHPGLVEWRITPDDVERPEYVCVYYRRPTVYEDDGETVLYPEGMVQRLYVPSTPPDTADVVVVPLDLSDLILTDGAAATAGAQLLGSSGEPYTLPYGHVFSCHPEYAKESMYPGNNDDPTSSYAQTESTRAAGTVTAAFTGASGWAGSNTPVDPTLLVFDGVDDNVDFGDLAECDFGTGPFSVTVPFRLDALGKPQTLVDKMTVAAGPVYTGWRLHVTASNNLMVYIGEDGTRKGWAIDATDLITGVVYYAALTFSGSGGTPKCYLGAAQNVYDDAAAAAFVGTGVSNSASLMLGAA